MLRWLALGIVLTLVLGVATYTYQEAEAINAIKGYVSAGGTTVAVEIKNGTTTTTTPETKPAPEECDADCQEHEEIEEEKQRYEEGQETAKTVADTIKEKVEETVKGTAETTKDVVWEVTKSASNSTGFNLEEAIANCRNTSCMLKARHQAEIWAYNQTLIAIESANPSSSSGVTVTLIKAEDEFSKCRNTSCILKLKHQAEIDAWEASQRKTEVSSVVLENGIKPCDDTACLLERKHQAEIALLESGGVKPCDDTACMLKRIHQAELDEFYGVTKDSLFLRDYNFTQQIIVINLSAGCEKALMQNVTTICPTYEELMQFNNINQKMSGEFVTDDNGFYHRGESDYKKHCNYYLPELLPVVIAVDGGECWIKERGAMTITVNAISTDNFKFKIQESFDIDRLRSIQQQDTRILNEEAEHQFDVDRLEDLLELRDDSYEELEERLEDFDEITRTLWEDTGENPDAKKVRADERQDIIDSYSNRSLDRQDRAWEKELREAQEELDIVLAEKTALRIEQLAIKVKTSGVVSSNSTIIFGIGRSIDNCFEAQVGSDIQMIADTINFLLKDCAESERIFDSTMIIKIEQTPINYLEHKSYNYTHWLAEAKEVCKTICKEY